MRKLLTFAAGLLLLTATACKETSTSTERVEIIRDKPAIVVPDKKVDVTIHNEAPPDPVIINQKTNSTTYSDKNGSVTTETHTETVD